MKQKKSKGLRKVFLMAVATALVIAISVSATLAYLTDSTDKRDNVFTGKTSNISGRIIEPNFNEENTYFYSPGKETTKDPEVENTSSTESIFTAIKLTFWIRVDTNGKTGTANTISYVQVPYSVFKEYVTIKTGDVADTFNADEEVNGSAKKWYQFNTTDENAKYFAYKTAVAAHATTEPIFNSVKMSEFINIPEELTGSKTVLNSLNGANSITAAAANLTEALQFNQEFKCCDFKIKIEGYGIDAGDATDINPTIVTNDLAPGLS